MRFIITGRDQNTGERLELVVEAVDAHQAGASAARRNIIAESISPASGIAVMPPPLPLLRGYVQSGQGNQAPLAWRKPRVLLGLILVAMPFIALWVPALMWLGVALTGAVLVYVLTPPLRRTLGWLLRVYPQAPARRAFKLITLIICGLLTIAFSFAGTEMRRITAEDESRRRAADVEHARAVSEANAKVNDLIAQAKYCYKLGM